MKDFFYDGKILDSLMDACPFYGAHSIDGFSDCSKKLVKEFSQTISPQRAEVLQEHHILDLIFSAAYRALLNRAASMMLMGAAEAEQAGNLIAKVWSNGIQKERDWETDPYTRPKGFFVNFRTALSNLFLDEVFAETISSIKENQKSVAKLMKELRNPLPEHEAAYDAFINYYDAYRSLTDLVLHPTGSLQTFSAYFHDADSNVSKYYRSVRFYLD